MLSSVILTAVALHFYTAVQCLSWYHRY